MAKCLRCGAGNEWIEGKVPRELKQEVGGDELRQATLGLRAVIFNPDDVLVEFERIGDWYYHETGFLRPGKSEPMETGRDANSNENAKRFADWFDEKKRVAIKAWEEAQGRNVTAQDSGLTQEKNETRRLHSAI